MSGINSGEADEVGAHPAARAWRSIGVGRTPTSIDAVSQKRNKKSVLCRLVGSAPDGQSVIAKRSAASSISVERRVYIDILAPLGIDVPHCYGRVDDPDGISAWLFLEDAPGSKYTDEDLGHRVLASSWLGEMHAATGAVSRPAGFPTVTLSRYQQLADLALASLSRSGLQLDSDDRRAVSAAVLAIERLTRQWPAIAELWDLAPHCLVHGDFIDKNALVDERGVTPRLRVLDWEVSGWGVPAEDLAGLDISAYAAHAASFWAAYGDERLRRLALVGGAFRAVAFLQAYSSGLDANWLGHFDEITHHALILASVEGQLGW